MTELRTYGGRSGTARLAERRARLVATGRTLLTGESGPGAFTVRAVCRDSGLTARYFYESFADAGELAGVVYDECIATITTHTLAAMAEVGDDPEAAVRSALTALVDLIADDPSCGRLLFSPALAVVPEIATHRAASTRLFVSLVGSEASTRTAVQDGPRLVVTAELLVGGVAQVVSAWLDGHLSATRAEVVDVCATAFLAIGDALEAFRDAEPHD